MKEKSPAVLEFERLRQEAKTLADNADDSRDWNLINERINSVRTIDQDDTSELGWMETQFITADGKRIAVRGEYDTREYHNKVARRLGCGNTRNAQDKLYLMWVSVTNDRKTISCHCVHEPTRKQKEQLLRARVTFPKIKIKIAKEDD